MDSHGGRTLDLTAARDYDFGLRQRGERELDARHGALECFYQPVGKFVPMRRLPAFLKERRNYAFSFEEEMTLGEETCKLMKVELASPQAPQPWNSRLGIVSIGQSFVSIKPKAMSDGSYYVEDTATDPPYGTDLDYCMVLPESDGTVLQTPCEVMKNEHSVLQISSDSGSGICAVREDYGLGIFWRDNSKDAIHLGGRRRIPGLTTDVTVNPLRPEVLLQLADERLILFDVSTKPILAFQDFSSLGMTFSNNAYTIIAVTEEAVGSNLVLADLRVGGKISLKFPQAGATGILSSCTQDGKFALALEGRLGIFDLRMLSSPWQTFTWDLLGSECHACSWVDWTESVQMEGSLVLLQHERSLIWVQYLFSGSPIVRKIRLEKACLGLKCVEDRLFLLADDFTVHSFTTAELNTVDLIWQKPSCILAEAAIRQFAIRNEEIQFIYDLNAEDMGAFQNKIEHPAVVDSLKVLPTTLPMVCTRLLKHWEVES